MVFEEAATSIIDNKFVQFILKGYYDLYDLLFYQEIIINYPNMDLSTNLKIFYFLNFDCLWNIFASIMLIIKNSDWIIYVIHVVIFMYKIKILKRETHRFSGGAFILMNSVCSTLSWFSNEGSSSSAFSVVVSSGLNAGLDRLWPLVDGENLFLSAIVTFTKMNEHLQFDWTKLFPAKFGRFIHQYWPLLLK